MTATMATAGRWADDRQTAGAGLPQTVREAETLLRKNVRERIGQLLTAREITATGDAATASDRERVAALIDGQIEDYHRLAAMGNGLILPDVATTRRFLMDDVFGLGRLQRFMDDPEVEEVHCNGPLDVWTYRPTMTFEPEVRFDDDDEVIDLVKRLIGPLGKRVDANVPMVEARLPDGSRLAAVIPPVAAYPCLAIRKFLLRAHTLADLVELRALPHAAAHFLECAVRARVNIVVSGGTGAGKTTLLNALGSAVTGRNERILTIEDTAELQLEALLPNCRALQARSGNLEEKGEVTIRDLVRFALRMRPTRIVVGEVRGEEALDMLRAMSTGHPGSMTTVHADNPREALEQLATMAMYAPEKLPLGALHRIIAGAIGLVVQVRFDDRTGERRVTEIFEVTGLNADGAGAGTILGHPLWALDGRRGLAYAGIEPGCLARLRGLGIAYEPPPAGGRG